VLARTPVPSETIMGEERLKMALALEESLAKESMVGWIDGNWIGGWSDRQVKNEAVSRRDESLAWAREYVRCVETVGKGKSDKARVDAVRLNRWSLLVRGQLR
jgi:hypothetical protein